MSGHIAVRTPVSAQVGSRGAGACVPAKIPQSRRCVPRATQRLSGACRTLPQDFLNSKDFEAVCLERKLPRSTVTHGKSAEQTCSPGACDRWGLGPVADGVAFVAGGVAADAGLLAPAGDGESVNASSISARVPCLLLLSDAAVIRSGCYPRCWSNRRSARSRVSLRLLSPTSARASAMVSQRSGDCSFSGAIASGCSVARK
jgi:hypothetical protein